MKHVVTGQSLIGRAMAAALALGAGGAASAISPFFQENWTNADDLAGWAGGAVYGNPGTGGVDGAADGYLHVSRTSPGSFGARPFDARYAGDYVAAGITEVTFWLNDVDTSQDFQIYFGIGSRTNFYQYNIAFKPAENEWTEFSVDLTDASLWTAIGFGTLSFFEALEEVENVLIRHDTFPPTPTGGGPPPIAGQLGIDKITFLPAPGAAALLGFGALVGGSRRRRTG